MSAPTRPCTPGRTSPRPGPITCTWSTPSTPPRASASRSTPGVAERPALTRRCPIRPLPRVDFDDLARAWLPLTVAVNSLNRSMGQPDLYPFVAEPDRPGKARLHPLCSSARPRRRAAASRSARRQPDARLHLPELRPAPALREHRLHALRHALGFLPEPLMLSALDGRGGRRADRAGRRRRWRQCAQRRPGALQLDGSGGRGGRLLPVVRARPHDPRPGRARQPRALAGARGGEAAAGLRADAARAAAREPEGGRGAGPRLRLPRRRRSERAGDDRPRRRAHHHQHRRGRLRRARAAARRAGRALPHAARPPPPRGRALLLGRAGARRRPDRGGRAVFGDESVDYKEALQRHYQNGAPADWQASFVSAYATMHPWEDFAETWTHYLHMVDTLDTAASFGLAVDPVVSEDRGSRPTIALRSLPRRATSTGWCRPGCR